MAGASIIMDVSRYMLSLVRDAVCPSLLGTPELVGAEPPDDKVSNSTLRVYLYSITDSSSYPTSRSVSSHGGVALPPLAFSLQYLIFFNPNSHSLPDPVLQHYGFGRVMQCFHRNPVIDIGRIHSEADSSDPSALITFLKLDTQSKQQIWSGLSAPMRPALYVGVEPLLLSNEFRDVPLTREMEGSVNQK